MSAIDYCICIEELARVDPAVALSVAAHNGLCAAHLLMFGSEEQKQRFLRASGGGGQDRRVGVDRIELRKRRRRECARRPTGKTDRGS